MGHLSIKLSQSNFNLRSPDCYLVWLIATVNHDKKFSNVQDQTQNHHKQKNNTDTSSLSSIHTTVSSGVVF